MAHRRSKSTLIVSVRISPRRSSAGKASELPCDPVEAAKEAGLRYVRGDEPGIKRLRVGRLFRYVDADGEPVRAPEERNRIKGLAIPPAWTDVWICARANGHLQATGRDAKGRKQYRYHARWRSVRDESKYDRMIAFGQALPAIRRRIAQDMALAGLPRTKSWPRLCGSWKPR